MSQRRHSDGEITCNSTTLEPEPDDDPDFWEDDDDDSDDDDDYDDEEWPCESPEPEQNHAVCTRVAYSRTAAKLEASDSLGQFRCRDCHGRHPKVTRCRRCPDCYRIWNRRNSRCLTSIAIDAMGTVDAWRHANEILLTVTRNGHVKDFAYRLDAALSKAAECGDVKELLQCLSILQLSSVVVSDTASEMMSAMEHAGQINQC